MSTVFTCLLLQIACVSIALASVNVTSSGGIIVTTKTITLPTGYIYYPSIRTAFKVHSEKAKWSTAKKECISEGGRLAVIDTQAKLRYVNGQKSRHDSVWVGINQKRSNWVTVDTGSRLTNLPWGSDQPEGVGTCVAIQKNGKGLYNRLCIWDQSFVCEIPIIDTKYQIPCHCG